MSLSPFNAVDVERFSVALRLNWVRRIVTEIDSPWRVLLQERVGEFDLTDVLRIKKCKVLLAKMKIPIFYKEIIESFQRVCLKHVKDSRDVQTQSLWHNDEIKLGDKPVFIKTLYQHGIKLMYDFMDIDGRIMKPSEIIIKYPCCKEQILPVQGIIAAIPNAWKSLMSRNPTRKLRQEDVADILVSVKDKIFSIKQLNSRLFYEMMLDKKTPTAVQRWTDYNVCPPSWKDIYEIPYKCTTSTRLQSLHYRIINRYIPTRRYLCTRGVIGSPLCRKCFMMDDLQHFFVECPDVKQLWSAISELIGQNLALQEQILDCQSIILGCPKAPDVVNLIILIAKQHIVASKLSTDNVLEPRISAVKAMIEKTYRAESIIAKRRGKTDGLNKKWKGLSSLW